MIILCSFSSVKTYHAHFSIFHNAKVLFMVKVFITYAQLKHSFVKNVFLNFKTKAWLNSWLRFEEIIDGISKVYSIGNETRISHVSIRFQKYQLPTSHPQYRSTLGPLTCWTIWLILFLLPVLRHGLVLKSLCCPGRPPQHWMTNLCH